MLLPRHLLTPLRRFDALFAYLGEVIIGRSDFLHQLRYALLLREHVLVRGAPGTGKSYAAIKALSAIQGAKLFRIQCTAKMSEDSLVGPPNVKVLRETGRFVHNTEGTLVEADLGFVDEFLDLSTGALRALLEVLNERTFSRGAQFVRSPLKTCVVTTNFDREKETELAAVHDRFLFRACATPLTMLQDREKLLRLDDTLKPPPFTLTDLAALQAGVASVQVSDELLKPFLTAVAPMGCSDRTLRKLLRVLRVSALLDGRLVAQEDDLLSLYNALAVSGDDADSARVIKAFIEPTKDLIAASRRAKVWPRIMQESEAVALRLRDCKTAEDFKEAAIKLTALQQIADALPDSSKNPTALEAIRTRAERAAAKYVEAKGKTDAR